MQESGFMSDCIPYWAVISSFIKLDQGEMAVDVFKEMIQMNVQPDVLVYGIVINAFADVGCVKEALGFVNAMREIGLPMNAAIYNSLIKLYTKVGLLEEAEKAYQTLQSLDEGADVYSSNCMLDLYSERYMVDQAEEIFENLRRQGKANEFSYVMILYGRLKEVKKTFIEMMDSNVQPDDSTFKCLGIIIVKRGVPKQKFSELELLWKKDHKSGLKKWMSILHSMDANIDDDP